MFIVVIVKHVKSELKGCDSVSWKQRLDELLFDDEVVFEVEGVRFFSYSLGHPVMVRFINVRSEW